MVQAGNQCLECVPKGNGAICGVQLALEAEGERSGEWRERKMFSPLTSLVPALAGKGFQLSDCSQQTLIAHRNRVGEKMDEKDGDFNLLHETCKYCVCNSQLPPPCQKPLYCEYCKILSMAAILSM